MKFISWDQERDSYPSEIANRATRFAIVRASVENIMLSAPEVVRPVEARPAPIAAVVETVPASQPEVPVVTVASPTNDVVELSRRAQNEARSASSLMIESEHNLREAA